jgi:hypothetical protein
VRKWSVGGAEDGRKSDPAQAASRCLACTDYWIRLTMAAFGP